MDSLGTERSVLSFVRLSAQVFFLSFYGGALCLTLFASSDEIRSVTKTIDNLGSPKSQFEFLIKSGKALFDANQLESARIEFSQAISVGPKEKTGYDYRGCLFLVMGEYDEAINDFTEVLKLDPSDLRTILNRANAYRSKRDYIRAIEDLDKYLGSVHTNDIAFKTRASTFIALGRFSQAIDDCNSSLKIAPKDAKCLVMRGCAQVRLGRFVQALADFHDSALLDPGAPEAYNQISWLRGTCSDKSFRNGKLAVEFGTRACELTEWANKHYLDTLAAAKAELGDFGAAISYEKRALATQDLGEVERKEMEARLTNYLNSKPFHEPVSKMSTPGNDTKPVRE